MKKIIIGSLVVLLLVTGCKKVPKLENGQDAVVSFKKGNISVDELYKEIKNKYALNTLIEMIDNKLLTEKYGDKASDEEKEQIENQISTWLSGFDSESAFLKAIQSSFGVNTMDELRDYLLTMFRRNKVIEDYSKSLVTDKEIDKFYKNTFFGDIKASHILIAPSVTEDMTTAEKTAAEEEALKKAKEVISKLNNGEKFEDLAREYSNDDSNKDKGGDLGEFGHGKMVIEFEEAVVKLKNGEYTKTPVKTQFGYHIILKVSQKEKSELSKVKDQIIEELAKEKLTNDATIQITALDKFRKDNNVEIQDTNLKDQYEQYLKNAIASAKTNAN